MTHTMPRTDDKFRHRLDRDGTYHSFCMTCFQTVAKSVSEADLTEGEEQHECFGLPPRWADGNA
jgi:hypothetical protein